jgi:hypothetical protein
MTIHGDGITHYYMEVPNFTGDMWDTNETGNLKGKGAVMGTDLNDLSKKEHVARCHFEIRLYVGAVHLSKCSAVAIDIDTRRSRSEFELRAKRKTVKPEIATYESEPRRFK